VGGKFGNEEPTADLRALAKMFRGMYVALAQEGFTEQEAWDLVKHTMAEMLRNAVRPPD
jgi:hypothetical protein